MTIDDAGTPEPTQPGPDPAAPDAPAVTDGAAASTPRLSATARPRPWLLPLLTWVGGLVVGAAIGVGVMGAVAAGGTNAAATPTSTANPAVFDNAVKACVSGNNRGSAEVSDQGETLTIDNKGEEDFAGVSYTELSCLLEALHAPQAVVSHIEQTTSMDGRQTEEWDDVEMQFTYHPDRGLDAVLTLSD
ncbi:hypothetical protein GCM10010988_13950 [Cnuibacter physcomitrellae]|uniref:Uncharacterized protein n=1 Tax=Cnuibacter physcomitrellae TaxID=1619308 RepID=A0A1X9LPH3_9MICO|nr:hypothetical protein [Cnuibacter physcomitrellae]ARJ06198.1 hypothetical protein B5808_13930 [Cnuibacter physcomitrellae]GGI37434.1 hypothetical protein GCM10010988_13950 [Cnuibacter physcomitrellae]